jgi:branched-chain amino acid transport system substrate-binding protein
MKERLKERLMTAVSKITCRLKAGLPLMICLLVLSAPGIAMAQSPGVTATEILIGQSCALTGPAQLRGKGMRDGALAYFRHVNAAGGINGRKIRLLTMDDGHTANASIVNTKKLIDGEKVFLLFGYVGESTSKAALNIAREDKVPFFSPMSGAQFLRKPLNRYVFNMRASYLQETEALIQKIVTERGIGKIAVFYEDSDFGKTGLEEVRGALSRHGLEITSAAAYTPNTLAVEPAGKELLAVQPDAVMLVGEAAPCAQLIIMMRNWGSDAMFAATSLVGSEALGRHLSNKSLGVGFSQVVPYPYDRSLPLVAEYNELTDKFVPEAETGFTGLEGFIAAKALCRILKDMAAGMSRENFITAAEKQPDTELGGIKITFSPDNHQGVNDVFFTQVIPGGFINPIGNFTGLYK